MNGNWSGPSTSSSKKNDKPPPEPYQYLVVDSGPIIKQTGLSNLFGKAQRYVTVPAVMDEIRDAKARQHLQSLPWDLEVKEASPEAYQRVVEFSKLTGDYPSLSPVDLQVLALVVDMEREGCLSLDHLRTTPKRKIGLGPISQLNGDSNDKNKSNEETKDGVEAKEDQSAELEYDIVEDDDDDDDESDEDDGAEDIITTENARTAPAPVAAPPSSWAKLVNPTQGSESVQVPTEGVSTLSLSTTAVDSATDNRESLNFESELESAFPSLAAAATVAYEGEDGEEPTEEEPEAQDSEPVAAEATDDTLAAEEAERQRKKDEALKPVSKSGKLYNSFRKYGKLMKPAPPTKKTESPKESLGSLLHLAKEEDETTDFDPTKSRILATGGGGVNEAEMNAEDDDGEGWITSTQDISTLKNSGGGQLDPSRSNLKDINAANANKGPTGPPRSQRAACTTTDFAMQNVILQMGLHLLSVDGMQIRRLKSWVLRCGACFKIHTDPVDPKTGMRRMFCSHCGSDMMQRISASVDGKNGRLKLHFSKKYKHNLRGTKFSLPKAGGGNRFQGDLLLREDQMLMGAWNQKVKKNSGGRSRAHAQSIFGKDIASNVGCKASVTTSDDIQVGFGRRNPNTAKGRERRGKKKKSSDRACGLRRY